MSRAVAIVQARMGSSRLPGKVLADLAGAPLLARMLERVRACGMLAGIVVATTERAADDPIVALAESLGVDVFRGSEDDVLARYADAADRFDADPIVRLTSDCPLIDPAIVDRCVETFLATPGCHHASLGGEFPDGLDTEVIDARALRRADADAKLPSEREHVTPYIWNRPGVFRCVQYRFPKKLGARRWTVDEPADLAFVRAVYAKLWRPGHVFGWREIEELCRREPVLAAMNAGIVRNAGYQKSLAADEARGRRSAGADR